MLNRTRIKPELELRVNSFDSLSTVVDKKYVDDIKDELLEIIEEGVSTSSHSIEELYLPLSVKKIVSVNKTNVNDFSDVVGVSNGDYVVLSKQTTQSENGLYLVGTGKVTSLQGSVIPFQNIFFFEESSRKYVTLNSDDKYYSQTIPKIDINSYFTIPPNSTIKIFDIPVYNITRVRITLDCLRSDSIPFSVTIEKEYTSSNNSILPHEIERGYVPSDSTFSFTSKTFRIISGVLGFSVRISGFIYF